MNKSKILKRSLAVILAMMMIFAMIPLSASAAGPALTKVFVNNQEATLSGTTFSVTVSGGNTTVTLAAVTTPGAAAQWSKSGTWTGFATGPDLALYGKKSGNTYELPIRANVAAGSTSDSDVGSSTEYTLKVTVDASSGKSNDTTVKSVSGVVAMTSYVIEPGVITINVPFGTNVTKYFDAYDATTNPNGLQGAYFTTTVDAATKALNLGNKTLTITAEDGSTFTYALKVVAAEGLTAFSVPDQLKDATITAVDAGGQTVAVSMPFEASPANKSIVVTFEHGANIAAVCNSTGTTTYAAANKLTSGTSKVLFTWNDGNKNYTADLYLFTDTAKVGTKVTVTLTPLTQNPAAELTEVTLTSGDYVSNPVAVSGESVTVEMPKGFAVGTGVTGKLTVKASKNARVDVTPGGGHGTGKDDTGVDIANVPLEGKTLNVRVTSEDQKTYKDYTINITSASDVKAEITDYSLKGKDQSGNAVTYTGTIDQTKKTITVKLPYYLSGKGALAASFKVYITSSVGSLVADDAFTPTAIKDADYKYGPNYDAEFADKTVEVTNGGEKNTYTVKFDFGTGSTARNLSALSLTSANSYAGIDGDNTFKGTVKSVKDTDGNDVSAIEIAIPYSLKADTTQLYTETVTVSEGAVAYWDTGTKYVKIVAHTEDAAADQIAGDKIKTQTLLADLAADTVMTDNGLDVAQAQKILVLSEDNAVKAGDEIAAGSVAAYEPLGHIYYAYAAKKKAEVEKNLLTVESTLDANVKATLDKSSKTVTITVPASYVTTTDVDGTASTSFTLNFTASAQATVAAKVGMGTDKVLTSDKGDKTAAANASVFVVYGDYSTSKFKVGVKAKPTDATFSTWATAENNKDTAVSKEAAIVVAAEDTTKGTETYKLVVQIAPASSEAKLLTAKVGDTAGVINQEAGTVAIALPYGTKLNPVSLTLEASKLAKIRTGTGRTTTKITNAAAYSATASYDLNNKLYIEVTAEDGKTIKIYELTATVAKQFSDVKDNAWYAKNVAAAAAAGIISGYTDGTFRPNGEVTRAEFAQMLVNMLGVDTSAYTTSAFKDVNETAYYSDEVAYIKDAGITAGYPDGTFRPNGTISRQEAAVMLAKALKLTATTDSKFADDAAIASWAKTPAYQCKAAQIFNGDGEGNFLPGANLTRAQAASIMVNSLANK